MSGKRRCREAGLVHFRETDCPDSDRPDSDPADALGLNLTQVKRYETGASQPSLDALKKIALTLSVSLDELVFGDAERGPDEALKLKFEAVRQFDAEERKLAEGVLDSLINNHQAKRLFARPGPMPVR